MRIIKSIILSLVLVLGIGLTPNSSVLADNDQIIEFPDKNFEKAVKEWLGKDESSPIYKSDLENYHDDAWGKLNLSNKNISNIDGIDVFDEFNYWHINLSNNQIKDISPLSNYNNLKELYISNNEVTEIPNLTPLDKLRLLLLSENNIEDFSTLSQLKTLKQLTITNSGISDISFISNLNNLEQLDLSGNNIVDLSPINSLKNLWYLVLTNNKISDLTPLKDLNSLKSLQVANNQVKDIGPLVENAKNGGFSAEWGAFINVKHNLLNEDANSKDRKDIELLKETQKNVSVTYNPQKEKSEENNQELGQPADAETEVSNFSDTKGHWAESEIKWAADAGLVSGFPDGTFRPKEPLTEAQFLTMIVRFYDLPIIENTDPWYKGVYQHLRAYRVYHPSDDPFGEERYFKKDDALTRGHVAKILASTQTHNKFDIEGAIDWMYEQDITKGIKNTGDRYENFGSDKPFYRSEAVTFLKRLNDKGLVTFNGKPDVYDINKPYYISSEGIVFVSRTDYFDNNDLKYFYNHMKNSFMKGKEWSEFFKVIFYDRGVNTEKTTSGNPNAQGTYNRNGVISVYNVDELSKSRIKKILAHEYGHHFMMHYQTWDNLYDWEKYRELGDLPVRWSGSDLPYKHDWMPDEILAEDYVEIFTPHSQYLKSNPINPRELPEYMSYWEEVSGVKRYPK